MVIYIKIQINAFKNDLKIVFALLPVIADWIPSVAPAFSALLCAPPGVSPHGHNPLPVLSAI